MDVAPGEWVLKGGFALDLRLEDRARSTKDIDLAWQTDEDELLDKAVGLDHNVDVGHNTTAAMLDPILNRQIQAGTWSPDGQQGVDIATL